MAGPGMALGQGRRCSIWELTWSLRPAAYSPTGLCPVATHSQPASGYTIPPPAFGPCGLRQFHSHWPGGLGWRTLVGVS